MKIYLIYLKTIQIKISLTHFIFYGNEGVGKFSHAIEFSNLILSKNADKNITRDKIKKHS